MYIRGNRIFYYLIAIFIILQLFGFAISAAYILFENYMNHVTIIILITAIISYNLPDFINRNERVFHSILLFGALASYIWGLTTNNQVYVIISILCILYPFIRTLYIYHYFYKLNESGIYEIDQLDGISFEYFLGTLFTKLGYKTKVTKASADYGADLVITKDGIRTVVQAKRYHKYNNVGIEGVQQVIGAIKYYDADYGMVVTTSSYTPNARILAEKNNITLWDRDILIDKCLEAEALDKSNNKSIIFTAIRSFRISELLLVSAMLISIVLSIHSIFILPEIQHTIAKSNENIISYENTIKTDSLKVALAMKEDVGKQAFYLNPEDMKKFNFSDGSNISVSFSNHELKLPAFSRNHVPAGQIRMQSDVRSKLGVNTDEFVTIQYR